MTTPKVVAAPGKTKTNAHLTITYGNAIQTLLHDRKMKHALLGIPFPVVYFCMFVAMIFDHIPTSTLYEHAYSVSSVLDSSGADTITSSSTMKFQNIETIDDVFSWLTDTFVPSVFVTEDYNGNLLNKDKWGRIANFNKVLGAVNFETTSAVTHPCQAQAFLTNLYPQCYDASNVATRNVLITFDTNATTATDIIARLKLNGTWLDHSTQSMQVTVVTYNGELQGYSVSKLLLGFSQGGYISKDSTTTPTVSDPYKENGAIVLDVLVGLCVIAGLVVPIKRAIIAFRKNGVQAVKHFGSGDFIDLVSTGFVLVFYALWIWMMVLMTSATFRDHLAQLVVSGKTFAADSDERLGLLAVTNSLENIADITIAIRLVAMGSFFSLGGRILMQFRFHPRLSILTRTITNALHQFVAFFIVFIVIFMTFTVSGMVLFGDCVESFSTLANTFESCINMLFGNFDYAIVSELQPPVGTLYYWAYMVVVCLVLLNMMLAIVLDSYAFVSEQSASLKQNVSFFRTLTNILYDLQLFVVTRSLSPNRRTINSKQAMPGDKYQKQRIVFQGRVIPSVLGALLEARIRKADIRDDLLTPDTIIQLFPEGDVDEPSAVRTICFLVEGSSRQPAEADSNGDDSLFGKPGSNSSRTCDLTREEDRDHLTNAFESVKTIVPPIGSIPDATVLAATDPNTNCDRFKALDLKIDLLLAALHNKKSIAQTQ